MTAQEIVESISRKGRLAGGRQRYRNVVSIVQGKRLEVVEPVNFRRPSWPGESRSSDYKAASKKLIDFSRSGDIPFHVPATEILKTVECRISEMLYFSGYYPEKLWGKLPSPLSVSKKIQLAGHLFPDDAFPSPLVRDIQNIRNVVEHQFAEPDKNDVEKMLATMLLFLDRTDRLINIFQDVSLFIYHVEDTGDDWQIQICRDDGCIMVFRGEFSSEKAVKIQTSEHIVKHPDYFTMLIKRLLTDLDRWPGDTWFPFHLDEILPNNLGPDIFDDAEEL